MSEKVDLRLDWCSYEAAKYAVEHWHYSRTMPKGRNNYIGVWESNNFIGSIIFGYSLNPWLGTKLGLNQTEVTELRRVALRGHKCPVSRMIAYSLKMLKRKNPGLRLVVSFADTEHKHNGGIYQASNWIYAGISQSEQKLINGKWRNDVHAYKLLYTDQRKAPIKYKYLYPLDDAMRAQIEPLRQPYPKRGSGETDSAAQSNVQTGGASPTDPLLLLDN